MVTRYKPGCWAVDAILFAKNKNYTPRFSSYFSVGLDGIITECSDEFKAYRKEPFQKLVKMLRKNYKVKLTKIECSIESSLRMEKRKVWYEKRLCK